MSTEKPVIYFPLNLEELIFLWNLLDFASTQQGYSLAVGLKERVELAEKELAESSNQNN